PLVVIAMEESNMEAMIPSVFIALVVIWIAVLGYFIFKLTRKRPEEVVFSDEGFHSRLFGQVLYTEVISYRISAGLSKLNFDKPSPSLHIQLQNGKKLRFDMSLKYYEDEIDDYMAFTERFVDDMAAYDQVNEPSAADRNATEEPKTERMAPNLQGDQREAKAGLEKARDRYSNKAKYAIPVSLAIGLIFLVR